jgi:hypothetical protein
MAVAPRAACLAFAILLPAVALAQDVTARFRLVAAPNNITGCIAADPQFTRLHTFTVKNGTAELTAPGGINTRMKLEKPNVYVTDYDLGQLNLHVVADLAASPPSLTVADKNLGCKWMAKKE